ncbi:hypothetical protein K432DRAFT_467611 [Lepidopterella palustris CBS 459.81]|uniref:DUF7702 domain-containing protein n=1 Tax=Lepidopterella palustris CBS 459.81 TaxID=1314670 RepID=A0A8E2E098_9PEZI|nr:hypothetical protein K432DRAFT_467611 [Lepidopterella palustris CBS 459.81]
MHIDSRGWVSVAELIVFIPSLPLPLISCSRHEFNRSSGWIYTLILRIVRVVGAICQLCTVDWIIAREQRILTVKHFRLLQLLITGSLILAIAGGLSGTTNPDGTVTVNTASKVSIVLAVVAFGGISLRISLSVLVDLPFIFVRLLYSALVIFVQNHTFDIVNGSVPVQVVIAVAEDVMVILIYAMLDFTV